MVRDNVRAQAAEQRAAAEWSHPEPADLAAIPGSRRQWERDPQDADFLVVRAGVHSAALDTALRVNDTADEVDLEPVSHSALRSLLDTQRTVRDVPTGIDLTKVSRITVLGDDDEVRGALRAWIAQAVTWHDPTVLGVALATPDLESPDWSWLKWLPHVDIPAEADGVGPARYLATKPDELVALLGPALADRPAFAGGPADALRHLLIIVDDPDFDLSASPLAAGAGRCHRRATDRPPRRTASSTRIPSGRSCGSPTARSSAGRPAAGSPTSTAPTRSASTTPRTSRAGCRAGTPTRRTAACSRRPPAARPSPRCWAFRMRRDSTCRRCGRRDTATTSCGCRSVSPPPASR